MRDRLTLALAGIAAGALLVAGCSDATSGTPTTTSTSTNSIGSSTPPTSSRSTDRYGAPRVEHPLDATQYLAEPCTAISPRLRQNLKIPGQGEAETTGALGGRAPSCRWSNLATTIHGESVYVSFLKGNKNGLADIYRQHEVFRDHAYWEETTVEGYPGVFSGPGDRRSLGECELVVGLSDPLAMHIQESSELGSGSCERAKQVAAAVIQTMKGQG